MKNFDKLIVIFYQVFHLQSTFPKSERAKNGGGEGEEIFCPRALEAPPHRPETSRAEPSRNFPFPFVFFRARAKSKNVRKMFLLGTRALASGGGAERQFRSKKVRAFSNKGHQ